MPSSGYDLGPPSLDVARDAVNGEPAITVPGSASPDGPYLASPQEAVSPGPIDDLWDKALDNYGLVRPTEVTEIHVFRVILQSSWDKNACTRTVTRTDPRDDRCIAPVRGPQPMNFPPLPMC